MKILYAVYHDCNKEERSNELLRCCLLLGEVFFVSYAYPNINCDNLHSFIINKKPFFAIFSFIKEIKKRAIQINPDLIVLHDSDCSVTIPYIKRKLPRAKIIYDSSELDVAIKGQTIKRKNGLIPFLKSYLSRFRITSEKKYMRNCDLVIAANKERAEFMVSYFSLKEEPIVFNNMHKINEKIDLFNCEKKFNAFLDEKKFQILFAGGLDEERLTFDYIKSFSRTDDSIKLIIAGSSTKKALERYNSMIEELHIKHKVVYLGFVSRSELKYLIQKTDVSVIVFDKKTYNTLFCASGKLYESLFEFKPILTSENPPLYKLCNEYGVGVSDDNYSRAIDLIKEHYNYYSKNVQSFVEKVDYDNRIPNLAKTIKEKISC